MRQPGVDPFTTRTPRVVAARRLQRRKARDTTGLFLAEGPQAVREATSALVEVFVTEDAVDRHPKLINMVRATGVPLSVITEDGLASLAETVTPQGIVAVCRHLDVTLSEALTRRPRLVAATA